MKLRGKSRITSNNESSNIVLETPEVSIFDEYDWVKSSPSETGLYLGQEIDNFLYGLFRSAKPSKLLKEVLGDKYNSLYDIRGITIRDEEGELLTRYGFANPFKINASYQLDSPLTIELPKTQNR